MTTRVWQPCLKVTLYSFHDAMLKMRGRTAVPPWLWNCSTEVAEMYLNQWFSNETCQECSCTMPKPWRMVVGNFCVGGPDISSIIMVQQWMFLNSHWLYHCQKETAQMARISILAIASSSNWNKAILPWDDLPNADHIVQLVLLVRGKNSLAMEEETGGGSFLHGKLEAYWRAFMFCIHVLNK